jgi:hypothetical protein
MSVQDMPLQQLDVSINGYPYGKVLLYKQIFSIRDGTDNKKYGIAADIPISD